MKCKRNMSSDQSLRLMRTESDQEINTMEIIENYATTICRIGSRGTMLRAFEEQQKRPLLLEQR